jgi:dephospho-CoA kinase
MKRWPDKVIIGLTGNIATGKSVVRRMLEHLGAFGIDADALGHRALDPTSPSFTQVLEAFGTSIRDDTGHIDRTALGRIVFSDPLALKRLEAIVHPLIRQAIAMLIEHASQKVIVIEAIKLLEGDLYTLCDSIWVTEAAPETQLARLKNKRNMHPEEALQRIQSQPPQTQKLAVADVVIHNDISFEATWDQVIQAWRKLFPETQPANPVPLSIPGLTLEYAQPEHASEIAAFMTETSLEQHSISSGQIMREFSLKTFIMLKIDDKIDGLAGWATENLVGLVDDIHLSPKIDTSQALPLLIQEAENASRTRQCEACILFIPARYASRTIGWESMGYEITDLTQITVQAWVEAVRECKVRDTIMFIKRLNQDLVFCV